jgi:hypothetical protein
MSISSVSGSSTSPQSRLLADLQSSGLASDKAGLVASEIDSAVQSSKGSSSGKPDQASVRAAIEKQLTDDVASGKLTEADATLVRKTLDDFEKKMGSAGGAPGGDKPDAAEMFKKLDSNGDGKLTKEEFVAGKPDNVTSDQAGALYDSLAQGKTDGLTQDEFTSAMASQKPPSGGGGGGGESGGGSSSASSASSASSSSSSSKVELSRTSTTSGAVTTTVITYTDGTKETKTSYGASDSSSDSSKSSTDTLLDLLKQNGSSSNTTTATDYLKQLLAGGLVDIQA